MPNTRHLARLSLGIALALAAAGALTAPAAAQLAPPPVVQISISPQNQIRVVNRGVGLCRSQTQDCPNQVVFEWRQGEAPGSTETRKIVIDYVKGTDGAFNCLQDDEGNPTLRFQLPQPGAEVTATVSGACPPKSAWLYKISCVRTDAEGEGQPCTGIEPVDPGVVIG